MSKKILVAVCVLLIGFLVYQLYWGVSIVLGNGFIGPFCLRDYALVDCGNGNKTYWVYSHSSEEGDNRPGCWRCIMLPHGELGFTLFDEKGKVVSNTTSKPGRPSDVDDYTDEALFKVELTLASQVRDGCYIIRGGDRNYYSVWTANLYNKWKSLHGK